MKLWCFENKPEIYKLESLEGMVERMDWRKETVLVTGGGGFLGRYIVRRLLKLGCKSLRIFGRSLQPDLENIGVKVFQGDLRADEKVEGACEGATTVFHTAAKAGVWGKWKDYYEINVTGTANIISACRKKNVPYLVYTSSPSVALSSVDVEGADETIPYPENYLAHYPRSKALAEKMVLAADSPDLATVSLRPHLIWGPGDPHLLPRLIERAKKGKLMRVGNGKNIVDLTYVENAAQAHILAAESLCSSSRVPPVHGKAYFISDGKPVVLWDWVNNLLERLDIQPVKRGISYLKAYQIGAVMELVFTLLPFLGEPPMTRFVAGQLSHSHYFNISAARSDIGYGPVISSEDALDKTVEYLQSHCSPK